MAALNTPGLNRWQQMQTRPFGTNTTSMGPPDPGASAYKRMAEDYGRALRETRRLSRRSGDPRVRAQAALQSARIGQEAINQGVSGIQGIRQAETQRANERGFSSSLGQAAAAQEAGNRAAQGVLGVQGAGGLEGARGVQGAGGLEGARGVQGAPAGGSRLGQPQTPRLDSRNQNPDADGNGVPDMIQRPAEAPAAQTPAGASLLERNRQQIAQRGFLDRVRQGLEQRGGAVTDEEWQNLMDNAARMGLDADRFRQFVGTTSEAVTPATTASDQADQPWDLAEQARAKVPGYIEAVDKVRAVLDRERPKPKKTETAKSAPTKSRVQDKPTATEEIAAANRELQQIPQAEPFVTPSNAQLLGSVAGATQSTLSGLADRARQTADQARSGMVRGSGDFIDDARETSLRNLSLLGRLGGYSAGRFNQAGRAVLENLRRTKREFQRGYAQNR